MRTIKHRAGSFLVPALLTSLILNAQYEQDIKTLNYTNTAGESGLTTYIYNGRDLPYKAIWELEDGSRWSVNYHKFNPCGRLVEKDREFSDSLTTHQTYIYDHEGRLIHETFSRSDGSEGHVDYSYRDGLCLSASCRGLNGWFTGEIDYHYNQDHQKDSATLYTEGHEAGKIYYRYDQKGRLWIEQWAFHSGFSQTLTFSYLDRDCIAYRSSNVFIEPSCNRPVMKETYDYNGEGGGPSYYDYDQENRLLKKTFVRSDGLETRTEYHYLENGLLDKSVRHYNDGKTGTFTYLYNASGQLIERNFLKSDGSSAYEKYRYDDEGRLISGTWNHVDDWLTGELLFSHDRYDNIAEAEFRGSNNINANISFTRDEAGDLQNIHWRFENGISQTYRYFYGP